MEIIRFISDRRRRRARAILRPASASSSVALSPSSAVVALLDVTRAQQQDARWLRHVESLLLLLTFERDRAEHVLATVDAAAAPYRDRLDAVRGRPVKAALDTRPRARKHR